MTKVLLMRTCHRGADGKLYSLHGDGSFAWPESGPVEAPDWDPGPRCGGGLHGLLWGVGSPGLWEADGAWLIVEADADDVVQIDDGEKVKIPRGDVVHVGDRGSALAFLRERDAMHSARRVYMGQATAGARGTATAGARGTGTAGARGTATAGDDGTIAVRYWAGSRYRIASADIGDEGFVAGVGYRVNVASGEAWWVRADTGERVRLIRKLAVT